MAMKYMKKHNLQIIDGLVCNAKGEVLGINPEYARLFNKLEDEIQEKLYLDKQPKATPMPSLEGFKRKHATGNIKLPTIDVDTPITDKRIEEALAFAKEVEGMHTADKANQLYKDYALLFEFVENDKVLVNDDIDVTYCEIDTPLIGNVLCLDKDELADYIGYVAGVCELEYKED